MSKLALSVILPVFNEAENLEPLTKDLLSALEETGRSHEIIFVDDGSTDRSLEVLTQLQRKYDVIVVIEFRRNFGQTAALAAGLRAAEGETVITMDADRQNDPRDIEILLGEIDRGMDLVCGWRYERKDGLWLRLLPSRAANWLISTTTDVKLHDYKVRSITSGKDAFGEVIIRLFINDSLYISKGTSTDTIKASVKAYLDALNQHENDKKSRYLLFIEESVNV